MRTPRCAAAILGFGLLSLPLGAAAETIRPGEVRTVRGSISAVDPGARSVTLEVPAAKGSLTVGVTMRESATPRLAGKPAALGDLAIGREAVLTYTREDDRLVGLELRVGR